MELLIGGYAQGKLLIAMRRCPGARVYDETNYLEFFEKGEGTAILNHFHRIVREYMEEGIEPEALLARIRSWRGRLIVISDEIGNGIVPVERAERLYREKTGRLLIELAAEAELVERVLCGIPQKIKP